MESAGWQAPLLRLLVVLSAALTLVPSNAAPAAASSSPVFLYPLLHGLLWAGLRGPASLFAAWVDSLSVLLPLAPAAALPRLTQGLVLALCHVATHAAAQRLQSSPGDQTLSLALEGLRRLAVVLCADDPVDLRAAALRLLRLPVPPGRLYEEALGDLTLERPDPELTPGGGFLAAENGRVSPVPTPTARDPHWALGREAFALLLGHVLAAALQILADVASLPQSSPLREAAPRAVVSLFGQGGGDNVPSPLLGVCLPSPRFPSFTM